MYASTILSAAALLFASIVSATPIPRASSELLGLGYILNDDLGYAWTKYQEGNSSEGVPIGLAPFDPDNILRTQVFAYYNNIDDSGVTTYLFAETDVGMFISTNQYTSSDDYAPGYWMIQTASSQAGAAYFTLLPGEQDGSWYIQTNSPSPTPAQLDWYQYDSPDASFIPIILDAEYADSSESWTWHSLE